MKHINTVCPTSTACSTILHVTQSRCDTDLALVDLDRCGVFSLAARMCQAIL